MVFRTRPPKSVEKRPQSSNEFLLRENGGKSAFNGFCVNFILHLLWQCPCNISDGIFASLQFLRPVTGFPEFPPEKLADSLRGCKAVLKAEQLSTSIGQVQDVLQILWMELSVSWRKRQPSFTRSVSHDFSVNMSPCTLASCFLGYAHLKA